MNRDGSLDIRLLGRLEIRFNGRRLAFPTRHAGFLIAVLALEGPLSREIAAAHLWGERGDEQARASLRQAVYHVQKVLSAIGAPELVADRQSIGLHDGSFHLDVAKMLAAIEGNPLAAAKLFQGELLGDVGRVDAAFQDWLSGKRQALAERFASGMRLAAEALHSNRDWAALERVAGACLRANPLDEAALRYRMDALAHTGRRIQALALFDAFRDDLRSSLQVEPEPSTIGLRDHIAERPEAADQESPRRADFEEQSVRERRSVSLLAVECTSISHDPEEFAATSAELRALLTASLQDSAAQVLEGTSPTHICVFGASGQVERHAEAAVRSAEALAARGGTKLKLAVVSGDIVQSGAPASHDLDRATVAHLVAEAVALLGQTAPGRIALSEAVEFRMAARSDGAPFVGRAEELDALASALLAAKNGDAQVVGIVGEAGLGKSTLLRRFLASQDSLRVLMIEGYDREASRSFGAVARFLSNWLDDGVDPGSNALEAAVDAGRVLKEHERALAELLGTVSKPEGPAPDDHRRHVFEAASRAILDSSETQPTILAVEDVHWLDRDSAEFIDRLIGESSGERLLVVATFRPEHQVNWIGRSSFHLIRLGPLAEVDAAALISPWLGAAPDSTRDLVLERAGGNPFFLVETARAMASDSPMTRGGVPATIRDVLDAQVHRLVSDDRRVLQCAAVLGTDARKGDVEALSRLDATRFDAALSRLRQEEILVRSGPGATGSHRFRHALVHDAVYVSIPKADLKALHEFACAIMKARPEVDPAIVALHAWRAEGWSEAHDWLRRAGDRFAQLSSYALASEAYRQAVAALERLSADERPAEMRLELALRLRPVLVPLGRYREALGELNIAESIATEREDRMSLAAVAISKSYLFSTHGRLAEAVRQAGRAADLSREGEQTAREANLAEGQARSLMGDWEGTVAVLRPALPYWEENRHERFGHTGTRSVWCHGHLSNALCLNGQFDVAQAHAERAFDLATETRRPLDMIFALHRLGKIQLASGHADEAVALLEDAIRRAEEIDAPIFRSWFATDAVPALLAAGRQEDASTLLNQQMDVAEQMDLRQFHGWLRLRKAQLLQAAGRPAEAFVEAEAALNSAVETGDLALEPAALIALAESQPEAKRKKYLGAARALKRKRGFHSI